MSDQVEQATKATKGCRALVAMLAELERIRGRPQAIQYSLISRRASVPLWTANRWVREARAAGLVVPYGSSRGGRLPGGKRAVAVFWLTAKGREAAGLPPLPTRSAKPAPVPAPPGAAPAEGPK